MLVDAAREVVAGTTVSSVVGRRLPSYFDILPSKQGAATSNIPILKIKTSPRPPTKDIRCRMRALSIPRKTCHYKRWYYNEKAQVCVSTCSNDAPFLSKIFCDGLCRTAEVCKFPMASFPCFHEVHPVFIYNPNEKSCFKSYSCSFFGNKFPTLDECRLACKKCAAKQQVGCLGKSLKSKDKDRNFSSSDRNRTSQLISHSSTGAVHWYEGSRRLQCKGKRRSSQGGDKKSDIFIRRVQGKIRRNYLKHTRPFGRAPYICSKYLQVQAVHKMSEQACHIKSIVWYTICLVELSEIYYLAEIQAICSDVDGQRAST